MKKLNEAFIDLEESIKNNKNYIKPYLRMAVLYEEKKEFYKALENYNKVK